MDSLYDDQLELPDKLKQCFKRFKDQPEEDRTRGAGESQLARLDHYFAIVEENDERACKLDKKKGHAYFTEKVLNSLEDAYYAVKGQFNDFFHDLEIARIAKSPPPLDKTIHEGNYNVSYKKLPPLDITIFSGNHSEWEYFRDSFRSLIHRSDLLNTGDRYNYLRYYIRGKAREIVAAYPLSDEYYEAAWSALVAYYENKRRLVHVHLSELFASKTMKSDDYASLNKLSVEVNTSLNALKVLDRPVDQWSDLLVFIITSKFHSDTFKEWQKKLGDSTEPPSLTKLKEFINSQLATLEAMESARGNIFKPQAQPKTSSKNPQHSLQTAVSQQQNNTTVRKPCSFCASDHYVASCPLFREKSVAERHSFVQAKQLCKNCLAEHEYSACTSQKRCRTCKVGRHHTLLHYSNKRSIARGDKSRSGAPACHNAGVNLQNQAGSLQPATHIVPTSFPPPRINEGQYTFQPSTSLATPVTRGRVLLGTALIKVIGEYQREMTVCALIDPCSQVSLISESLCQRLALRGQKIHAPITGAGGEEIAMGKKSVSFQLQPHFNSDLTYKLEAIVLLKVSSYTPPLVNDKRAYPHLKGLQLADPQFMEPSHVDVLLGAAFYSLIVEGAVIKGASTEPIAIKTTLGWVVSGSIDGSGDFPSLPSTSHHVACDDPLDNLIQKFWEQEEIPLKPVLSQDDQACEEHFVATHERDPSGRYVVRLPFKDVERLKSLNLGESVHRASKVLLSMESKFRRDEKLRLAYHEFMKEYKDLGHMTEVGVLNTEINLQDSFFLPHHGVWKESSETTKLRTVFNASSKLPSCNLSLNDLLYTGPDLLPNLADLICSWRRYEHGFVADIEKMYRQVLVHPDDWKFQSILWRFDSKEPMSIFQLETLTYGEGPSSYIAPRVLRQLASDHQIQYPLGAEVLQKETYMDDTTSGAHSVEEAKKKLKQTIELCKEGGFNLRKCLASSPSLLNSLPGETLTRDCMNFFSSDCTTAVLGLAWQPHEDSFRFNISSFALPEKITKRTILSHTSRIFDPLGWLAPIIIIAKIRMQSTWLLKIDWDSELPAQISQAWNQWREKLMAINEIRIPRWNNFAPEATVIELHGFADASKLAYGAAIYLRIVRDFEVTTSLELAKSKVSPLKVLSIPRLELCAAHVLAKLVHHFLQNSPIPVQSTHLWTDSADVLYWLKGQPSKWNVFVANRCSNIHILLPSAHWHHVRSKDNPADILSRGCPADELKDNKLWWYGPEYLSQSNFPWSVPSVDTAQNIQQSLVSAEAERSATSSALKKVVLSSHNCVNGSPYWDLLHKYSSLTLLLRVTSYCLRFVLNIVNRLNLRPCPINIKLKILKLSCFEKLLGPISKDLSTQEMERSQMLWVYLHQSVHFSDIVENFLAALQPRVDEITSTIKTRSGRSTISRPSRSKIVRCLKGNSALLKLDPICVGGFLRVGGRLAESDLKFEQKHPLILADKDPFTTLLIRKAHHETLHGTSQDTLNWIRTRFWIIRGRNAVKKVISRCNPCLRYSGPKLFQKMADLPKYRVTGTFPFVNSGIDYAGPVSVRLTKSRGKGTMKGYIALFICTSTRAVHLELVEDYTSESFIAAFHRFTARRGHCSDLFSDQGTNFIGADTCLQQLFEGFQSENSEVFHRLINEGTQWHFNPPKAAHFGGLWEAGIKSAKHHLRRVIGEQVLTFTEYNTMLCRIEAVLNSRPIIPLSNDPTDLQPLTPAHFLIMRNSFLVPVPDQTRVKVPLGKRWDNVTRMVQSFWARWSVEYLVTLQPRKKWFTSEENLQIGDMVYVTNETTSPGKWPVGRVIAAHPDKRGAVRVIDVKTPTTILTRPIVKLIRLSTEDENIG